jgi:hypothetical protein
MYCTYFERYLPSMLKGIEEDKVFQSLNQTLSSLNPSKINYLIIKHLTFKRHKATQGGDNFIYTQTITLHLM